MITYRPAYKIGGAEQRPKHLIRPREQNKKKQKPAVYFRRCSLRNMDYKTFKDMDLSRDEVERLTNALKDEQFKKLFFDYVDELHDPENRRIYQSEIVQLEKERGVDATFINPTPGYVIKTSVDGDKKCFLNICSNENVKRPSSSVEEREGAKGLQWSLPHSLSPVREDVDRKGVRCGKFVCFQWNCVAKHDKCLSTKSNFFDKNHRLK